MAKTRARARRRYFGKVRKSFRKKPTVSVAILAGFAAPVSDAYATYKYSGLENAVSNFSAAMTGYQTTTHKFVAAELKRGLLPVMTGALIHKAATMLGINRMISSAGIPFIRI